MNMWCVELYVSGLVTVVMMAWHRELHVLLTAATATHTSLFKPFSRHFDSEIKFQFIFYKPNST